MVVAIPELRTSTAAAWAPPWPSTAACSPALFDLALGCTPALLDPSRRCATLQLSITFQRPATGNTIRAEAEIDSHGKSTLFASARILDDHGQRLRSAQGVVRLSPQPWSTGDSPSIG